ncbi:MAG: Rieske (2Fe-2S) protein [Ilumatobacteraceae bacterium]
MSPTVVCALDELAPGTVRRFEIDGVAVAVVRIDDDVYALGDVCSHANVSLSGGDVWTDERELECPKHGSTFDLATGEPVTLPATQPVPVFEASVVDGDITVTVTVDASDVLYARDARDAEDVS